MLRIIKLVLPILILPLALSAQPKDDKPKEKSAKLLTSHTEKMPDGTKFVVKVIEEIHGRQRRIRVQTIKSGTINEHVYYLETPEFSIAIPITDKVMIQPSNGRGAVVDHPDPKVTVFAQLLEAAREAMLKTDYDNALRSVNKALDIDNNNVQVRKMKGSIYYSMGRTDLAREEWNTVLKLDPDEPEVKQFMRYLEARSPNTRKTRTETRPFGK